MVADRHLADSITGSLSAREDLGTDRITLRGEPQAGQRVTVEQFEAAVQVAKRQAEQVADQEIVTSRHQ